MRTPHHQNVCRHDHKRYHAWAVSIRRRGRILSRYFADRRHGGRRQALQAALAFRDHALDALPPLLFVMRRYVHSKTGVIGVMLQIDRKPQGVYRAYVASWPDPSGARRTRSFSLSRYGKERAFKLAVKARRQGVAHLSRAAPKTRPLNRRRKHSA